VLLPDKIFEPVGTHACRQWLGSTTIGLFGGFEQRHALN
jgi:hypothetical protein